MELDFKGDEEKIKLNESGIMRGTNLLEIHGVALYVSLLNYCIRISPHDYPQVAICGRRVALEFVTSTTEAG